MTNGLDAFNTWADSFLAHTSPAAMRSVLMQIGRSVRQRQMQRIRAQQNPDGSCFIPRKHKNSGGSSIRAKQGRIKSAAMFKKLASAQKLKVRVLANGVSIGYTRRDSRIANIHQEGGIGRVRKGVFAQYPQRILLGLSDDDLKFIQQALLAHLH